MKKILLIIALVFCIFQIVVAYSAIDMGSPAIDRGITYIATRTYVNKTNPANASGKITKIEIYARDTLPNCEVGIFYVVSGDYLSTRATHFIGTVTGGAKRTFTVNLTVVAGDYLGIYYTGAGRVRADDSGYSGVWYRDGDCIPCTNEYFEGFTGDTISLYGTGETIPNQVTNVQATDGVHTDKVRVTWNVASGADKYYCWNGSSWIDRGTNLFYDHTGAPAPTITAGTASASDGTSTEHVTLSIAGESANNGSSVSYKVKAYNTAGYGAESASNSGYRGVGTLTYQWQRSAGDSDADYSNIDGATTDPYNDTGAPANGDGRYYKCVENATGASQQTTNSDRGYRDVAVGWQHLWDTKTISKWNTKEFTKWNDLE